MSIKQDRQLLQEAKALAAFKTHLSVYLVVMASLWLTWFFDNGTGIMAWPVYPSVAWGIVLVVHFLSVYRLFRDGKKQRLN